MDFSSLRDVAKCFRCPPNYAAETISNLTSQPTAEAARDRVVSVSEVFCSSSMRFTAARLVPSFAASSETVMPRRFICFAKEAAITFFSAAASTSS